MDNPHQYSQGHFLNISINMVGNFNILVFSVLISLVVNVAKFVLCHIRKLLILV